MTTVEEIRKDLGKEITWRWTLKLAKAMAELGGIRVLLGVLEDD